MPVKKLKNKDNRFVFNEVLFSDEFDEGAELEILTTAKQTDPRYGDFSYAQKDLEVMAKNFNEDILGREIAVDLNHERDGIALAWIVPKSMTVKPSTRLEGQFSLFAQLHRFTPKGEDFVKTGALRYFSVELVFELKKFVGKVKKTFKNVIVGLALTNRPVIKDMAPTFSESNNPLDMTTEEKAVKAKEEAAVKEAEAKVEAEGKEEEVKAEEKTDAEAAELAEAVVSKILSEQKTGDLASAKVMEGIIKQALSEPLKQLNAVLVDARHQSLSEDVKGLMLSDSKHIGIKSDAKDSVLAFVKKLSVDMAKEYFELHKDIMTSVDLSEIGSSVAGPSVSGDAHKEAHEKAEKLAEEKDLDYRVALDRVLSEDKELADKVL